jgi:hypothetical protein
LDNWEVIKVAEDNFFSYAVGNGVWVTLGGDGMEFEIMTSTDLQGTQFELSWNITISQLITVPY